MPVNKSALIRYQTLDRCFRNTGRNFFFEDLQEEINKVLMEIDPSGNGISRRQLLYDIGFMEGSDGWEIPLERIRVGRKLVFRYSDPNFSINNQPLNQTEIKQIESALFILSRFQGLPQFEWISEMIPMLENKLGISGENRKVIAYDSNIDYQGYDKIAPLFNAIINKRVLEITYKDFKSPKAYVVVFHPHYLKQYNNRWFVFGKNENPPKENSSVEVWTLSLDRIQSIAESNFTYLDSMRDWEAYFDDIIGVTRFPDKSPEEVKLLFSSDIAPYAFTKPLHLSQKPKWLDCGELEIRITVIPNYELESVILSFGEKVKVLEPEWMRTKIKDRWTSAVNNPGEL